MNNVNLVLVYLIFLKYQVKIPAFTIHTM